MVSSISWAILKHVHPLSCPLIWELYHIGSLHLPGVLECFSPTVHLTVFSSRVSKFSQLLVMQVSYLIELPYAVAQWNWHSAQSIISWPVLCFILPQAVPCPLTSLVYRHYMCFHFYICLYTFQCVKLWDVLCWECVLCRLSPCCRTQMTYCIYL